MTRTSWLGALLLAAALAGGGTVALGQGAAYTPGPHNVRIPADWQATFIRYTTVDKPDRKIIRNIYVNPEAFAAIRKGEPFPNGTLLVMADQRARVDAAGAPLLDTNGRMIPEPAFIAIAAQEKRTGWGVGYGPEKRNGEWEYAAFTPDLQPREVNLGPCFTCHLPRAAQDFTFSTWDYAQTRR
jgi:hypothetical protein